MSVKIPIKQLEHKLNLSLVRNHVVMGVDAASTSGVALLNFNSRSVTFDSFLIKFGKHHKGEPLNNKFSVGIDNIREFKKKLIEVNTIVIEDPFCKINKAVYGLLSSIRGIYFCSFYPECSNILLHSASTARKIVGFKRGKLSGNRLKEKVVKFVEDLGFGHLTHDEADAVICALSGAVAPPKKLY